MTRVIEASQAPSDDEAVRGKKARARRGWLAAGGAALSIALIAGAIGILNPAAASHHTTPATDLGTVVTSSTPGLVPSAQAMPATVAQPRTVPALALAELASRLRANPGMETQGRYTYVSVENWFGQGDGVCPQREQRWFDTQTRRSYSATLTLPTVSHNSFRVEMVGHTGFEAAQYTDAQYLMPQHSMPPPLSSDPAELRRILEADTQGHPLSGPGMLTVISGFSSDTHPPVGVRAAALELLSTFAAITVAENVQDARGRTGIQIRATASDWSAAIIVDPATGLALAYETHLHTGPGSLASSSWGLILANSRTDSPDLPS